MRWLGVLLLLAASALADGDCPFCGRETIAVSDVDAVCRACSAAIHQEPLGRTTASVRRDGRRVQLLLVGGEALDFPEPEGLLGHPVNRPGHAVGLPGHPVTRPAAAVTRPAHSVTLPAQAVERPGHAVERPGFAVTRPDHAVTRPGQAVERPGFAVERPDRAVDRPGHPVLRPGSPLALPATSVRSDNSWPTVRGRRYSPPPQRAAPHRRR